MLRQGLLCAALLLIPASAKSATALVEWDNPTQREDGSPLPLSELAQIKVFWGSCKADGTLGTISGQVSVPSPSTAVEIQNIPAGTYCFVASAVDTEGQESGFSNVAQKTFKKSRPRAPRLRGLK